jgi:hypothetical protein
MYIFTYICASIAAKSFYFFILFIYEKFLAQIYGQKLKKWQSQLAFMVLLDARICQIYFLM